MKLVIAIIVCTLIYAFNMRQAVVRAKAATTDEEKEELQTGPVMFFTTVLYGVVVYQLIRFSMNGVLPLL